MPEVSDYPSYLTLQASGELRRRAETAVASLVSCAVCPRQCAVDRLVDCSPGKRSGRDASLGGAAADGTVSDEMGPCNTRRQARVTSAFAHHGEEPCISGDRGSGTIFFAGCNLACVFCQNSDISQCPSGQEMSSAQLASCMLKIQQADCHNINLVSPSHVVPQVLEALAEAVDLGLRLPIVYNSGGYDALESLRRLDGVVDIYMPDLKFLSDGVAERYVLAPGYAETARAALVEMHRQVGDLEVDRAGAARRGLLVRHLVMPGMLENTRQAMEFVAREVSANTCVNLMGQYRPQWQVGPGSYPEIDRRPTAQEMAEAVTCAREAGVWRFA